MDHKEFSSKGGRSTSEKKRKAVAENLKKARDSRARKADQSLIVKTAGNHSSKSTDPAVEAIAQDSALVIQRG